MAYFSTTISLIARMFLFIVLLLLFRASAQTTTCCREGTKERVVATGKWRTAEAALGVFQGLGIVNADKNWQQHSSGMKTTVVQIGDMLAENGFDILDMFITWKGQAAQVKDEVRMTLSEYALKHLALEVGPEWNSSQSFGHSGVLRKKLLQIVKGTEVITRPSVGGKVSAIFVPGGVPRSFLDAYSENGEILVKKINAHANEILKQNGEKIRKATGDLTYLEGNPLLKGKNLVKYIREEQLCNKRIDDILDRFEVTHIVVAGYDNEGRVMKDQLCEGQVLPLNRKTLRTFEFCDDGSAWSFEPNQEQKCKRVGEAKRTLSLKIQYKVAGSENVHYVRIPPGGGFEGVENALGNQLRSIKIGGEVYHDTDGSDFPGLSDGSELILEFKTMTVDVKVRMDDTMVEDTMGLITVNLGINWAETQNNVATSVIQLVPFPMTSRRGIHFYIDKTHEEELDTNPEAGATIYVVVMQGEMFNYIPEGLDGTPKVEKISVPTDGLFDNSFQDHPQQYAEVKRKLEEKHAGFVVTCIKEVSVSLNSSLDLSGSSGSDELAEWTVCFAAKVNIKYKLGSEPKIYTLKVAPEGKFDGVQNELAFLISSITIDGDKFNIDSNDGNFPVLNDNSLLTLEQKVYTFNKPHDPVSKNGTDYTGKVIGIKDGTCSQYITKIGKIGGFSIRTIADSIAPCDDDDDMIVGDGSIQVTWQEKKKGLTKVATVLMAILIPAGVIGISIVAFLCFRNCRGEEKGSKVELSQSSEFTVMAAHKGVTCPAFAA